MISLNDIDGLSGQVNCAVERGCDNKEQCFCSGKCHEIIGHIKNGKFVPNSGMGDGLTSARATNMWGANIKDVNQFCDKITKNAGPRDI